MWVPQSDQDPGHPGHETLSNTVCVPRSDMGIGTIFSLNLKPEGGKFFSLSETLSYGCGPQCLSHGN